MGHRFLDQYSLLHASVGVIFYFWEVPFWISFILHAIFELIENSKTGIKFLQYISSKKADWYIPWPGGKYEPDALINQMGDNLTFALGWISGYLLDDYGKKQGWYNIESFKSY